MIGKYLLGVALFVGLSYQQISNKTCDSNPNKPGYLCDTIACNYDSDCFSNECYGMNQSYCMSFNNRTGTCLRDAT